MFELTPREVIVSLLEEMGKYPVLWEHHKEAYNEEYGEAIQYLCEQMNEKWLLKISPIKMRRSITRIFRFYRFLFPFDTIEQFEDYFDKCATFLPSAVIEIPHARCFQCWRCFKRDNELINHIVTEHKNFSPYKCLHCRESFETNEEKLLLAENATRNLLNISHTITIIRTRNQSCLIDMSVKFVRKTLKPRAHCVVIKRVTGKGILSVIYVQKPIICRVS